MCKSSVCIVLVLFSSYALTKWFFLFFYPCFTYTVLLQWCWNVCRTVLWSVITFHLITVNSSYSCNNIKMYQLSNPVFLWVPAVMFCITLGMFIYSQTTTVLIYRYTDIHLQYYHLLYVLRRIITGRILITAWLLIIFFHSLRVI